MIRASEATSGADKSWHVPALVGVFALSRAGYWLCGVRFDTSMVDSAWQLLPSDLLRHDLLKSLWYLHSQPPLFNFVTAAGLRAPISSELVFNWLFLACGLALTLTMFSLMRELNVPPTFAFVATLVFVVRPSVVLYENWYFYTYPVALALTLTAWLLARFVRTADARYAWGFAATLGVLGLTRATFHPVFLVAAGAFFFYVGPRRRRGLVAAALAVPLLLVVGLFVKNWVLFGEANSSSWAGMNLAKMVLRGEDATVKEDVSSGQLPRLALQKPFQGLAAYHAPASHTDVPALDLDTGALHPNFNNLAYIKISNDFGSAAFTFIRLHPITYVSHLAQSYETAYANAVDYPFVAANRSHISWLASTEAHLDGQVQSFKVRLFVPSAPSWSQIEWLVVVQYLAVVWAGISLAVPLVRGVRGLALPPAHSARRRGRAGQLRDAPWIPATTVFVAGTVLFTSITSSALELGENMRFRFETDPLVWVVFAALVATIWRWQVAGQSSRSVMARRSLGPR